MQITFLVGNGFDIACGIETSYRSFYEWYIKQDSASEVIKQLKNEIHEDLIVNGDKWADLEVGLGLHTEHFTEKNAPDFIDLYEDIHEQMIKYLEEKSQAFLGDVVLDNDVKNGVLNFYQELQPQEQDTIRQLLQKDKANDTLIKFISFNYTDFLDSIAKELSKNPLSTWSLNGTRTFRVSASVLHVHGTINRYPILGVSDETQFFNANLADYPGIKEIMIKSESVKAVGEHWYNEAYAAIQKSQIICIFGMSLGESDSHFWHEITEWLSESDTRHVVVFWYLEKQLDTRSIYRYLTEKQNVVKTLFDYSSLTNEKIEKVRERIHVVFNTEKVLQVKLNQKEVANAK